MIALAIFAFGLLALAALQVAATRLSTDSQNDTRASLLANEIIGMMWGDSANLPSYDTSNGAAPTGTTASNISQWQTDISAQLPSAVGAITASDVSGQNACSAPPCLVTVTISWQLPGGRKRSYPVITQIGY